MNRPFRNFHWLVYFSNKQTFERRVNIAHEVLILSFLTSIPMCGKILSFALVDDIQYCVGSEYLVASAGPFEVFTTIVGWVSVCEFQRRLESESCGKHVTSIFFHVWSDPYSGKHVHVKRILVWCIEECRSQSLYK
jgi:hypothetical protein